MTVTCCNLAWARLYAHARRLPEGSPLDPQALLVAPGTRLELEIGPGRGSFLVERLQNESSVAMIGIEIRRKWVVQANQRIEALGLADRGCVFAEDARQALPRLKQGAFHAVFLSFPDPWWKRRHQKRRLLTPGFVGEIGRILRPGGELFIQTDVPDRASEYQLVVENTGLFEPAGARALVAQNPFGAQSSRERCVQAAGLPILRLLYRRTQ